MTIKYCFKILYSVYSLLMFKNTVDFLCVDLISFNLDNFQRFFCRLLEIFYVDNMSSVKKMFMFYSFLSNLYAISFFFLLHWMEHPVLCWIKVVKCEHSCLVPDFRERHTNFTSKSNISIGFFYLYQIKISTIIKL